MGPVGDFLDRGVTSLVEPYSSPKKDSARNPVLILSYF